MFIQFAHTQEEWDNTVSSSTVSQLRNQHRLEAAMKREKALAYAFSHQVHIYIYSRNVVEELQCSWSSTNTKLFCGTYIYYIYKHKLPDPCACIGKIMNINALCIILWYICAQLRTFNSKKKNRTQPSGDQHQTDWSWLEKWIASHPSVNSLPILKEQPTSLNKAGANNFHTKRCMVSNEEIQLVSTKKFAASRCPAATQKITKVKKSSPHVLTWIN